MQTYIHRISSKSLQQRTGVFELEHYLASRTLLWVGHVARMPKKITSIVPSAGSILSEMPKSALYSGLDALALPNGHLDDSEKMLLFPESVIKAAVDTLKEVAIDDFNVSPDWLPPPRQPGNSS